MEVSAKFLCMLALFLVACSSGSERAAGARECGSVPVNRMALKMAPCRSAAKDAKAQVSAGCCTAVKNMSRNPSCLCAVMLSDTAKRAGVKPEVAITIPKRCNLADRPVGYKCGGIGLLYASVKSCLNRLNPSEIGLNRKKSRTGFTGASQKV
ncbi:hypothetical protein Cni_G15693 [Canna indica]|uniref:Bifunctional inhibitor/plant lipid transfer protein/seed storage helical domain-containing protein n=1 Tax=Canna indica TaxID=4628 RepID=A0AAQ3QF58_9LILI|nr:hypothetical protein Cni_G15693 [Canna indica]